MVQTLPTQRPSPHVLPLLTATATQPLDGVQLSFVQGFPSSQTKALPPQLLALQVSWTVQALPSSQLPAWAMVVQPLMPSQ